MSFYDDDRLKINYFQSSAPRIGTHLHLSNQKNEFFAVSKKILIKEKNYELLEKIMQRFSSIWEISSPVKHLEIELTEAELEWNAFYLNLKSCYDQIVWLDVQMEQIGKDKCIYYFDFIPIAKKESGFPLETNFENCLEQEFGSQKEILVFFLADLKKKLFPYVSTKKSIDKASNFNIQKEMRIQDRHFLDTSPRLQRIDNSTTQDTFKPTRLDIYGDKTRRSNNWIKKTLLFSCVLVIVLGEIALVRPKASFKAEIDGDSMLPTYYNTEKVVVAKSVKEIQRFDVVVFNYSKTENYIKRVIGLPGENIIYKDGELYVNDELVEDPYRVGNENFTLHEIAEVNTIPPNHYLVLGDNQNNSADSRSYGLINGLNFIGMVKEE
ncbi:signal peptidase I [Carnobacterium divergens]|uniref:signal peptidase I n=1 Tax=Carnobacterium divergens TaxID=2748 RepID=UPI0039C8E0FF